MYLRKWHHYIKFVQETPLLPPPKRLCFWAVVVQFISDKMFNLGLQLTINMHIIF